MKIVILALVLPLLLASCLSFSQTKPAPTTVIVPPSNSTTVICSDGRSPPC